MMEITIREDDQKVEVVTLSLKSVLYYEYEGQDIVDSDLILFLPTGNISSKDVK